MEEKGLIVREDKQVAIQELETRFAMAVRQRELLENYIRERLKPDKHFYTVGDEPGRKPSLTKEGAELICLPHNLKPRYIMLSGPDKPPPDNSPYQITVNCSLYRSDTFEGNGIGSASSYITTKSGEFKPRQKDPGLCHNATLKMAQKSAYIAATLNSTAASEFFTQDLEDDQSGGTEKPESKGHWCPVHKTPFFMKGKMKSFAHPIGHTNQWCYEPKQEPEPVNQTAPVAAQDKQGEADAPEGADSLAWAILGHIVKGLIKSGKETEQSLLEKLADLGADTASGKVSLSYETLNQVGKEKFRDLIKQEK